MKKLTFILSGLFMLGFSINAQSYSINKHYYDHRMYVPEYGDPYNPALSGVASFFIPGLGQMISGEVGRGFAFLGGSTACGLVTIIGATQFTLANAKNSNNGYGYYNSYSYNSSAYGQSESQNVKTDGLGLMLAGLGGMIVVNIWSIVDAVKVAKVNNMYIRDMRNKMSTLDIRISPYAETISLNNGLTTTPVGLSLQLNF